MSLALIMLLFRFTPVLTEVPTFTYLKLYASVARENLKIPESSDRTAESLFSDTASMPTLPPVSTFELSTLIWASVSVPSAYRICGRISGIRVVSTVNSDLASALAPMSPVARTCESFMSR